MRASGVLCCTLGRAHTVAAETARVAEAEMRGPGGGQARKHTSTVTSVPLASLGQLEVPSL